MILSLKLYESGPKALREVGGPSRIRMTKRFSKSFVSVRTLLLCPTVFFFCLSLFRSCGSLKGLCSFVICERFRVSLYEWTALELESFLRWRIYELVKIKKLSHKLEGISETHEKKHSHFFLISPDRVAFDLVKNGS